MPLIASRRSRRPRKPRRRRVSAGEWCRALKNRPPVADLVRPFIGERLVAIDTECTGLNAYLSDRPFGFGFCNDDGDTLYLDVPVNPDRSVDYGNYIRTILATILQNPDSIKVFFNGKFDLTMFLEGLGIECVGEIEDVSIAARVANSDEPKYRLKFLARKYLDYPDDDEQDLRKAVIKARRKLKPKGWATSQKEKGQSNDDVVSQDYFLAKALDPECRLVEKYCVGDVVRTMGLWLMYWEVLRDLHQRKTYRKEMTLLREVMAMERRGVAVNPETLKTERDASIATLDRETKLLRKLSKDPEFNPNSPKQLQDLLFDREGLPVLELTDNEDNPQPSTKADVLVALKNNYDSEAAASVLRYRSASKGIEFYDSYLKFMRQETRPDVLTAGEVAEWIIHADAKQEGTRTGRFSYSRPNLQQTSKGSTAEEKGVVPIYARKPFGPRRGYVWLLCDYEQLEARLFADLAEEPFMLAAFAEGRDLHQECANKAWGGKDNPQAIRIAKQILRMDDRGLFPTKETIAVWKKFNFPGVAELDLLKRPGYLLSQKCRAVADRVAAAWLKSWGWDIVAAEKSLSAEGKSAVRNQAKRILFTRIFAGGPGAAAAQMHCSYDEAAELMNGYAEEFPRLNKYIQKMTRLGRRQGYIVTRAGRRLTIPDDKPYKAVNYSIQSLAADIMKRAMIRTMKYIRSRGLDAHLVLTIHDELIYEIREDQLTARLAGKLVRTMSNNGGMVDIPTPVEPKLARHSWADAEKIQVA